MKNYIGLALIAIIFLGLLFLQGYDHYLSIDMKHKSIPQQVVEHVTINDTVGLEKFKQEYIEQSKALIIIRCEHVIDSISRLKINQDTINSLIGFIKEYSIAYESLHQKLDNIVNINHKIKKELAKKELILQRADSIITILYMKLSEFIIDSTESSKIDSILLKISKDSIVSSSTHIDSIESTIVDTFSNNIQTVSSVCVVLLTVFAFAFALALFIICILFRNQ